MNALFGGRPFLRSRCAARKKECELDARQEAEIEDHCPCDRWHAPWARIKIFWPGAFARTCTDYVDECLAENGYDARAQDVLEELHDRWKGET